MYHMDTCGCQCQKYAMAVVPMQEWGELYDWKTALCNGTIFPDLNLEFFAAQNMSCAFCNGPSSRQEAMKLEIDMISFALNDLMLYLDTHPDCEKGLTLFGQLQKRRHDLLKEYASCYYPLTQDSMNGDATGHDGSFSWSECPAPWEGGICVCGTMKSGYNFR
ncbi:MAG: spore coat protein CotJB [bacterium]|nr:spore coat protein CotJB [bacterium]